MWLVTNFAYRFQVIKSHTQSGLKPKSKNIMLQTSTSHSSQVQAKFSLISEQRPESKRNAKTRAFPRYNYRARTQQKKTGGHSSLLNSTFPSSPIIPTSLAGRLSACLLTRSRSQQPSFGIWWWKPNSIVRYAGQPIKTTRKGKTECSSPLSFFTG